MTDNNCIISRQPKLKRILFVTHDEGLKGGASIALLDTMLDMKERYNIEPVLLSPKNGEFPEICRKNNIEVIISKFCWWCHTKGFKKFMKGILKFIANKTLLNWKILWLLRHKHFDLIYTNTSVIHQGIEIARHLGIPHIWHIREYGFKDNKLYYTLPKSYVQSTYNKSNAIIAISRAIYNTYVKENNLCSPDRMRLIYDGIKITDAYDKMYLSEGHVNFCITGRQQPLKNQIMAVRACTKLKDIADKFTLHIIGTNTGYTEKLKQIIKSEGIEDNVKFWGFRYDVNDILRNMDVGLMLSVYEGFGRVTAEYMMNYMSVIGVDTGATPEIVLDGETGYICSLNDTDRLAELMRKFIMNPELIREMGTKGRERAMKNFSLERNTDEIYQLCQEILSR